MCQGRMMRYPVQTIWCNLLYKPRLHRKSSLKSFLAKIYSWFPWQVSFSKTLHAGYIWNLESQITRWLRGPELLECILWAVSPYRRSLFASKKILKRNWCQRAELWEWGARKVGFLGGVFFPSHLHNMQNCWKSLRFCFSPQVAESEETIRKMEMELAMSQEKHRTCTQEVKE